MSTERERLLFSNRHFERNTVEDVEYCTVTFGSTIRHNVQGSQIQEPRPFKRRWYVLAVFALMCFTFGAGINTFGTIANTSEQAFDWTDSDIALITNWQPIAFILSIGFFTWLLDTKGLRVACVLSAFLLAAGSGVRCVSYTPPLANWVQHTGSMLVGLSSPVVYSAPSTISATWFPMEQRTIATAISTTSYAVGFAFMVLLGPALVHVHNNSLPEITTMSPPHNGTINPNGTYIHESHGSIPVTPTYLTQMRQEIALLLYIEAGIAALVFILMLVYFPNKPPVPPSASASTSRMSFMQGVKKLFRNGRFWILCFVYSATNGLYSDYSGILNVDLKAAMVPNDQQVAGYMIFLAILLVTIMGLAIARVADIFVGALKLFLIVMCVLSTGFMLWFCLLLDGYIPYNTSSLYISFILASVFINSGVPILYEMTCECTYPIAEGLTNGVLNMTNNILALLFYFTLMIPNIGTSWMHWCMMGACAACIPILIPFKQKYGRLEIDAIVTSVSFDEKELPKLRIESASQMPTHLPDF